MMSLVASGFGHWPLPVFNLSALSEAEEETHEEPLLSQWSKGNERPRNPEELVRTIHVCYFNVLVIFAEKELVFRTCVFAHTHCRKFEHCTLTLMLRKVSRHQDLITRAAALFVSVSLRQRGPACQKSKNDSC